MARQAALALWPDFKAASDRANQQVRLLSDPAQDASKLSASMVWARRHNLSPSTHAHVTTFQLLAT